jgi:hypothetical protein
MLRKFFVIRNTFVDAKTLQRPCPHDRDCCWTLHLHCPHDRGYYWTLHFPCPHDRDYYINTCFTSSQHSPHVLRCKVYTWIQVMVWISFSVAGYTLGSRSWSESPSLLQGIHLDPGHGLNLLLCNRSAVLLQLGRKQEALQDALRSLELSSPSFAKVCWDDCWALVIALEFSRCV